MCIDFYPEIFDRKRREFTYSSAHCLAGLERIHGPGAVSRQPLQCQGSVLYRVSIGHHDPRRIVKNAELAHLLYIDERQRRLDAERNGTAPPVGQKFVYNCVGLAVGEWLEWWTSKTRLQLTRTYIRPGFWLQL